MSDLERRYRKALRWYPTTWRLRNEEAALGTLLDAAEGEERTSPRRLELANLAIHGFGSRVQTLPAAIAATVRDRASTAALALGAAIALTAVMQLELPPDGISGFRYQTFGPFSSPAIIVYAGWIAAFFAAMAGFATTARIIAVASIPLWLAVRAWADLHDMGLRPTWSFMGLLILLAVLVATGRPGSTRAGVRWLIGWFLPAVIALALPQVFNATWFSFQEPFWLNRPQLISWSAVIAVVFAAALQLASKSSWAVAVLLLGVPFTAAALMGGVGVSSETALLSLLMATAALGPVLLLRIFGIRVRLECATRS